jgi:energy-coupling factor transporter ATP-binding protein EcfA2
MSIEDNLVLAASPDLSRFGLIDHSRERAATNDIVAKLQILAHNLASPVRTLSGGNQQKVVIGKWLLKQPRILLLNDPTRGIDVGTKQELYRLMRELAGSGLGLLFYSTDYEELIGMSDRVVVCYGGKLIRELSGPELNEHNLITASLNLGENNGMEGSRPRDPLEITTPKTTAWQAVNRFWKRNAGPVLSFVVFAVMFILFASQQANGLATNVLTSVSNKGASHGAHPGDLDRRFRFIGRDGDDDDGMPLFRDSERVTWPDRFGGASDPGERTCGWNHQRVDCRSRPDPTHHCHPGHWRHLFWDRTLVTPEPRW